MSQTSIPLQKAKITFANNFTKLTLGNNNETSSIDETNNESSCKMQKY